LFEIRLHVIVTRSFFCRSAGRTVAKFDDELGADDLLKVRCFSLPPFESPSLLLFSGFVRQLISFVQGVSQLLKPTGEFWMIFPFVDSQHVIQLATRYGLSLNHKLNIKLKSSGTGFDRAILKFSMSLCACCVKGKSTCCSHIYFAFFTH
jgi:hypothetical protein